MKFQTMLLTFFGVMGVVALIIFSQSTANPPDPKAGDVHGNVEIWGTFPENDGLIKMFHDFNETYQKQFTVTYKFHDPKDFDRDIVEALASDKGPDILLLPDDLILRHSDKIEKIPYLSFPQGVFSANFVQAAEIYMRDDGLVALPFAINPMVMYWNRDIFNNASITQPPKHWDELLTLTPLLTKRNARTSDLEQSAVAFGEFSNVTHAKDVLSMLFLQVGNRIVKMDAGIPVSSVTVTSEGGKFVPDQDVVSALRFYMDFSDPLKTIYTWSRARSNSLDEFINGNLAIHFDYASANKEIALKNPHLNFAVAKVPQLTDTKAEVTFAKVYGLSVLSKSKNKSTAFVVVKQLLLDANPAKDFAAAFDLPPVRRDLLAVPQTDAAMSIFFDAAIRARTWLDPKPELSDKAFQTMVESISSGKNDASAAVEKLGADIESALNNH